MNIKVYWLYVESINRLENREQMLCDVSLAIWSTFGK